MATKISIDDLTPTLVTTISEAGATITISSIQITDSGGNVLDDTAVSTAGGYIRINGSHFTGGSIVIIGSVAATSVTYISPTVYLAQVPAQTAGSYIVYLVSSDGSTATRPLGLTYSGTPAWVTGTTLTSFDSGQVYSNQLSATGATSYELAAGSTLPTGLTLSSSGLLSGTVTVESSTTYIFTINAIDAELQDSPRTFTLDVISNVVGQVAYTTAGTYSWTAPAGVTRVSVVAVGGGGSGRWGSGSITGGAGGGLGWKNNITVVPGQNYSVVVGAGGDGWGSGAASYFINQSTVAGLGGAGGAARGSFNAGGSYVGDGGGNGGNSGTSEAGGGTSTGCGGGGAGGYSGNGGTGKSDVTTGVGSSGAGGGGGGGGAQMLGNGYGGPGGGVGILGQGANGAGGSYDGSPGSGGVGQLYGGGGGAGSENFAYTPGGSGAVRIIWGAGRAFPSTLTADQ